MLSDTLKEQTAQAHQQLEKYLIRQIKSIQSVTDYTAILKGFYGFISPLENAIEEYASAHIPDMASRRKSEGLLNDLRHFGDVEQQNEDPGDEKNLPEIRSAESALGALYVFEGSTLGGEHITLMIARKLGITTDKGFSFFNSYGNERLPMWRKFKENIDVIGEKGRQNEVVAAASQTFTLFHHWLSAHENNK